MDIAQDLMKLMDASPVNFLAAQYVEQQLQQAGFKELKAEEAFPVFEAGDQYYVTKNGTAVFAFRIGKRPMGEVGFKLICAHSDSPGFRIKPKAEMKCEGGIVKLNTEVYGGPILYTWFDRPLSVAGRVLLRSNNPLHPIVRRIKVGRPLLIIPHLAIHFNRSVNDGNPLSKQRDMLPVLGIINNELEAGNLLLSIISKELGCNTGRIELRIHKQRTSRRPRNGTCRTLCTHPFHHDRHDTSACHLRQRRDGQRNQTRSSIACVAKYHRAHMQPANGSRRLLSSHRTLVHDKCRHGSRPTP